MKSSAEKCGEGGGMGRSPFFEASQIRVRKQTCRYNPSRGELGGMGCHISESQVCTMRKNLKDGGGDGLVLDDDVADEERQDPAGSGAWWGRLSGPQEVAWGWGGGNHPSGPGERAPPLVFGKMK